MYSIRVARATLHRTPYQRQQTQRGASACRIRNRVIVGESIEFNNQAVHCVLGKKSNEMYLRLCAVRFVADSLTRFNGQKILTSSKERVVEERSTSQRCVSSRTNMYVGRKETFLQIYTYALCPSTVTARLQPITIFDSTR